jgi:hypothetical protein
MTIKTKISFKEFVALNINILFEDIILKLGLIFLLSFSILVIFSNAFYRFNAQNLLIGICILFFGIFFAIFKFFQLKKIYKTNKYIKEELIYIFFNEKFLLESNSLKKETEWKTIYKVNELKKQFLIYYDSYSKNTIPKKDFTKDQISELRNIIKSNHVKAKLRND